MRSPEEAQCKGKMGYRDELSAKIALGKAGRMGQLGPDALMNIYRCKFCGAWHMGHSVTGRPWYEIWR